VNFNKEHKDKWFNVENYVKYMCDRQRALIKREAKKYTIEEFYQKYAEIVRSVAIDGTKGRFFEENGMLVFDCEVLSIYVQEDIADLLVAHQEEMVEKALKLSDAQRRVELAEKLAVAEEAEQRLRYQQLENKMLLQKQETLQKLAIDSEVRRVEEAEKEARTNAELAMQDVLDEIADAGRQRKAKDAEFSLATKTAEAKIEEAKQKAYADTIKSIFESIDPSLVAAMNAKANASMLETVSEAMAPYAIANGESVAETVNKLLRGTSLESIIGQFNKNEFNL
jgi:major vault protein